MRLDPISDHAIKKRETGAHRRAWSRLPHSVARDRRLDDKGLVALAIRSTYADDASAFGLSVSTLKRAVRGGFGRDVAERTIKNIQEVGYLVRRQPSPACKGGKYYSQPAVDHLILPEQGERYQIVRRQLFDATHSIQELAGFFYLRAGTGKGPLVYARELQARFCWSHGTTNRVLNYLVEQGWAERRGGRTSDAKFSGIAYVDRASVRKKPEIQLDETVLQNPGSRQPGLRTSGHKHKEPQTERTPNIYAQEARLPAAAPPAADETTWGSRSLLGWVNQTELPQQWLADVPEDALDAIWKETCDDVALRHWIVDFCDGQVSKAICSDAGLEAVRVLAAFIYDGLLLNQLALWAPDAGTRKKILVDNPAQLYQF